MTRLILWLTVFFASFGVGVAHAEEAIPTATTVRAKPNTKTYLASAVCFVQPVTSQVGTVTVEPLGSVEAAYILLPADRRDNVTLELKTARAKTSDVCVPDGALQVTVQVEKEPQISAEGVQQAFTVLMAAFVLALLLESAFGLLFNWRLFQAFFIGRAWRTPIMFFATLAIVRHFDLDLLSQVFAAYHGTDKPSPSWTSSVLTAMILSGGSVGVNRLMVALRFRPAKPKTEEEKKEPNLTEAYVAIDVMGIGNDQKISVEMQETDKTDNRPPTLAVISVARGSRLKAILFPSRTKFPSSGGMTLIASTKCYRFVVRDLHTQKLYNVDGREIERWDQASEFCFAPRSVNDFIVDLN